MKDANELRRLLQGNTGSEQIFHHDVVKSFNYTEGVRAFFQNAGNGAYWLSNVLATEPKIRKGVLQHGIAFAVLEVIGTKAKLVVARDVNATEDNEGKVLNIAYDTVIYERLFDYTDCPEGVWKLYLTDAVTGENRVILALLPSEY